MRELRPITRSSRPSSADAETEKQQGNGAGAFWTTFGSLAVVVALILIIARSWKKHGPLVGGGLPVEAVELLGKRPIDQRQTLHMVRLGSKILLLGSSAEGLRTLSEVNDPVDVDYLAGLCRQSESDGSMAQTFRSLFNRQLPQEENSGRPPLADSDVSDGATKDEQGSEASHSRFFSRSILEEARE